MMGAYTVITIRLSCQYLSYLCLSPLVCWKEKERLGDFGLLRSYCEMTTSKLATSFSCITH